MTATEAANRTGPALLSGSALAGLGASALAVTAGFVVSVVERTLESNALIPALVIFLWLAVASSVAALLIAATVGLTWHAVAQRLRWTSLHAYWLPGAVVGLSLSILTGVLPFWGASFEAEPNVGASIAPLVCPFGATLGGLVGLFFWLIRRPDRDAANLPTSAP